MNRTESVFGSIISGTTSQGRPLSAISSCDRVDMGQLPFCCRNNQLDDVDDAVPRLPEQLERPPGDGVARERARI